MVKHYMYTFVDDERPNPLGGKCYDCEYCYIHGKKGMKIRFKHIRDKYSGKFKLYPKILNRMNNIRSDKPIFFCDCICYMHKDNTEENILEIFWEIKNNRYNTVFLSMVKNPIRYIELIKELPVNMILGVTVEANRDYPLLSNAPIQSERINQLIKLRKMLDSFKMSNKLFISIEPILKFDLLPFLNSILKINPDFGVAIGYDNHYNKLDEPSLKLTLALRNNLIIKGITVYDKTLRKAYWEK